MCVLKHGESQAFTRFVVALRHFTAEFADARNIGGAFGDADGTAGVKKVEGVSGLKNHFVGRQRELEFHQALGFAFKVIKLLEELFRVTGFKVVVTLLDFVLMEDVAVGERVLFAQSVGPV